MSLVMYHEEQDALRIYLCKHECWEDMLDIYIDLNAHDKSTSLTMLISYGWELVGEL